MVHLRDIFGQPAVESLRTAYLSGRLPHALLFAGPEGVGRRTTATALAGLFLCEKPRPEGEACGGCDACRVMSAGTHPDFHLVYRQLIRHTKSTSVARDLPVDVVRQYFVAPASRSSAMGVGKVFVIEEAERMNPQAQNAALKTLEEPSGRTLIILLTTSAGELLPTIRSRCRQVLFTPLPDDLLARELRRRGVDEAESSDLVRIAGGSLGRAVEFHRDGLVPVVRELEQRLTAALSGRPQPEGRPDLPKFFKEAGDAVADALMSRDPDGSKDQATREGLQLLMRLGADHCRRYLRVARTQAGMEKLCGAIEHLTEAGQQLDGNVNVTLALQTLSARLEA